MKDGKGGISLDDIQIAAPCNAAWEEMSGDDRARMCRLCNKHVYNLSDMTRADSEALINQKEGRLCIQFYRRADGTIMTDNCPVGLRRIRKRMKWIAAGAAALFVFGIASLRGRGSGGSLVNLRNTRPFSNVQNVQPFKTFIDLVDPPRRAWIRGEMAPLRPTPPPPTVSTPAGSTQPPATQPATTVQ